MTNCLLFNIYKNLPLDTKVIVVDDCSTDEEVSKGLMWWQGGLFSNRMKVYKNENNCGFLRSSNFGVSKADTEYVALISNDVKISDRTVVDKVVMALEGATVPTLVGNKLLAEDTGWNTFNGVTYPYLDGHFLAFNKLDWVQIGGFDTRYKFADFEDVDLSTEFLSRGGKLVCIDADIIHLGAQTYKYSPEREAQTKKNQKKFEDKWVK